jgi:hypothetical protein
MVRGATRFKGNWDRIQLGQERQELTAAHLLAQHHLFLLINPMKLEDALRRVDPNPC